MTFAAALAAAMTARGLNNIKLAARAGVSEHTVSRARQPRHKVAYQVALLLAEVLDTPELARISARERRARCPVCRNWFVKIANYRQAACSVKCREYRRRKRNSRRDLHSAKKDLLALRGAIAAFCRGCEPGGLCRDAACEMRPESPLPLVVRRVA